MEIRSKQIIVNSKRKKLCYKTRKCPQKSNFKQTKSTRYNHEIQITCDKTFRGSVGEHEKSGKKLLFVIRTVLTRTSRWSRLINDKLTTLTVGILQDVSN
jgi:hypothetical protein